MKNPIAQQLGRMAKGKPKTYTPEELERRRKQMALNQKKRWNKPEAARLNAKRPRKRKV